MEALSDLKRLLCDVKEKTGTEVRLSPRGGDETRFTVEFGGERAEVYLDGSGKSAEQTAGMIRYLLANADMLRPAPEKDDYLKNILLGEGGDWYAFRFLSKYNLTDGACFAVTVQEERRLNDTVAHLERCVADTRDMVVKMDETRCAVVKFCEEGQSPFDFAQFLSQSLYEEIGVKASVGVGCETDTFTQISASYRQAVTALRMSGLFHSKGEVHSYKEYLLVKMLEDVPESRLKDYLEQLQIGNAAEVFEDEDMLGTAEEFLENSLNISETSRNLYMHRNTLMYRLDKIERITGLNIRKFSDAVSFRVITILYKLMQL